MSRQDGGLYGRRLEGRSSTWATRVKIAVRCGSVSRMKTMSRRPFGSSPTTTTFIALLRLEGQTDFNVS